MSFVWRHILAGMFLSAVMALFGYAARGITGALAVLVLCLAVWLIWQFRYIIKLAGWLESPKISAMPQVKGMWANIFDTLLLQAKSRKKRKQKLGAALQRFYRAAEVIPNGILVLDKNGRISWMNGLAVEHLNLDPHNDWESILRNVVRRPEFLDFLNRPLEGTLEIRFNIPKNGGITERALLVTRAPFQTDEELLITHDITEAERLNSTRTAFVANVSHELRTPLTVISGFLETLADTPNLPPEQTRQFIGMMQKESARMQTLLADLLTLSRLESGRSSEHTPVDLSALAQLLAEDGETLSAGKHTIRTDIASDLWINGIYTDLYNGLSNLVFNAVRYTPAGGIIEISLKALPADNLFMLLPLRFAVKDNGPGIAAEHIPRLTERFYRVDKGRSRQSGGTGLGLAIVKHALAEHDTALEISSEVGKGSEFAAVFRQIAPPAGI
ncbi:phosphate regulon sensor histidine kinase PhoR [Uruburuella testudinis]|uniref:Phosphate regulon sensor protein PhoR n=1 Tax=Uruburuella testudinis TaxID=1282863 RepID=A0ABY4DWY4_9NEIS|nr:phosphate regulon sensor histidine kinase PhoR [Uruburuella testudinis]UOO82122.1 phosphate regulon sensor histidine kinase PhoR [Uruburuella testudinis]